MFKVETHGRASLHGSGFKVPGSKFQVPGSDFEQWILNIRYWKFSDILIFLNSLS